MKRIKWRISRICNVHSCSYSLQHLADYGYLNDWNKLIWYGQILSQYPSERPGKLSFPYMCTEGTGSSHTYCPVPHWTDEDHYPLLIRGQQGANCTCTLQLDLFFLVGCFTSVGCKCSWPSWMHFGMDFLGFIPLQPCELQLSLAMKWADNLFLFETKVHGVDLSGLAHTIQNRLASKY